MDDQKKVELIRLAIEADVSDYDKIYCIQSMLLGYMDEEFFIRSVELRTKKIYN